MQKSPASVLKELGKQKVTYWSNDLEKKPLQEQFACIWDELDLVSPGERMC